MKVVKKSSASFNTYTQIVKGCLILIVSLVAALAVALVIKTSIYDALQDLSEKYGNFSILGYASSLICVGLIIALAGWWERHVSAETFSGYDLFWNSSPVNESWEPYVCYPFPDDVSMNKEAERNALKNYKEGHKFYSFSEVAGSKPHRILVFPRKHDLQDRRYYFKIPLLQEPISAYGVTWLQWVMIFLGVSVLVIESWVNDEYRVGPKASGLSWLQAALICTFFICAYFRANIKKWNRITFYPNYYITDAKSGIDYDPRIYSTKDWSLMTLSSSSNNNEGVYAYDRFYFLCPASRVLEISLHDARKAYEEFKAAGGLDAIKKSVKK